jgi:hypothetical protein
LGQAEWQAQLLDAQAGFLGQHREGSAGGPSATRRTAGSVEDSVAEEKGSSPEQVRNTVHPLIMHA